MPALFQIFLSIGLLGLFTQVNGMSETTRSDEECVRYRRAWHLLSEEEKKFTLQAMLDLRRKPEEIEDDVVAQLANVHKYIYTSQVIHQSSANLFWHGYLVWEMESRIRMLDEKYECFAMPYYDFSIDYGRESHPSILESVMGGFGDPDDFYKVNGYSWDVATSEWYVAYDEYCLSSDDLYPLCSVKRRPSPAYLDGKINPSAEEQSSFFLSEEYSNFKQFSLFMEYHSMPLAFMTGGTVSCEDYVSYATPAGTVQGYDPIWWLFHSFIQYQLSMWISCRGNDEVLVEDLQDNTNAYTSYCGGEYTDVIDTEDCALGDSEVLQKTLGRGYEAQYQFDFSLDAPLSYTSLEALSWPYVAHNTITIRELYDISAWNIQYELGTYYDAAGLRGKCASDLNTDWFVDTGAEQQELAVDADATTKTHQSSAFSQIFAGVLLAIVLAAFYYRYRSKDVEVASVTQENTYGSVPAV